VLEITGKNIVLAATLNNFENFMTFIDNQLMNVQIDYSDRTKILTACEEIIVNIIHYAYKQSEGNLEIRIFFTPHAITLTFADSGIPFDPLAKPDADINAPIDERQTGGLGILMVKKLMDEVKYEYKDSKNNFTIIKYIEKT
jgi:serine/threonine-protein kinase RsbW